MRLTILERQGYLGVAGVCVVEEEVHVLIGHGCYPLLQVVQEGTEDGQGLVHWTVVSITRP